MNCNAFVYYNVNPKSDRIVANFNKPVAPLVSP